MGILPDWMIETGVKITPMEKAQVSNGVISYGLTSYGYDARCGYRFKVFTNVHGAEVDPKNFDPKAFVDLDVSPRNHKFRTAPMYGYECVQCGMDTPYPDYWGGLECPQPNFILIPPNSFALAETIEHFDIPRDVLAICVGKSTYARCGIIINVTPLEPEWRGKVTVEISNTTPLPARIYAGEGIMQVLFFRSDGVRQHTLKALMYKAQTTDFGLYADLLNDQDENRTCRTSYADRKGKYQDQEGLKLPEIK